MRTLIERHLGGLHATLENSSLRRVDDIASALSELYPSA
jgi:hypothetical protein